MYGYERSGRERDVPGMVSRREEQGSRKGVSFKLLNGKKEGEQARGRYGTNSSMLKGTRDMYRSVAPSPARTRRMGNMRARRFFVLVANFMI